MNDENLKPAQPGEVRNPNGRPKGSRNRSTIVKSVLERLVKDGVTSPTLNALKKMYGDTVESISVEEAITLVQVGDALAGKNRGNAYKLLMDSAYGAPKQSIEHTGEDGGPIQMDDLTNKTDDELRARIAILRAGLASENAGEE